MTAPSIDFTELAAQIKAWGQELGFARVGITDVDVSVYAQRVEKWLESDYQGDMAWLKENRDLRYNPDKLHPGTTRIISVAMNYLPRNPGFKDTLANPNAAYISRYALGRDYHKLIRKRLEKLAAKIQEVTGEFGYRTFADSAPVLEKPIAEKAGLGWIGKHTILMNREMGSWFFLGELFTDLPIPLDQPFSMNSATRNNRIANKDKKQTTNINMDKTPPNNHNDLQNDKTEYDNQLLKPETALSKAPKNLPKDHCGRCQACIKICPTNAIIAPYKLDARRCISYLTIEHKGSIPIELRPLMGNRVYGCDDCQIICPWNRFAKVTDESDFNPRHNLDTAQLVDLFLWTEEEFLQNTLGSAIRRIGHERWLRNLAVGLGNAPRSDGMINALKSRVDHPSELVREHIIWALEQHK